MLALFFVWFAGVVGSVSFFLGFLGFISGACALFCSISYTVDGSQEAKKLIKPAVWTAILVGSLWAIVPSQKTAYYMAGAYIGTQIVKSDTADKVVQILNLKLDEYLLETIAETNKKIKNENNPSKESK